MDSTAAIMGPKTQANAIFIVQGLAAIDLWTLMWQSVRFLDCSRETVPLMTSDMVKKTVSVLEH